MFGVVRMALGGWLLLLPKVSDWGFSTLSVILFALLLVSGLVGIVFAPDTTGRDLEETQEEPTRRQRFSPARREEASEPVGTARIPPRSGRRGASLPPTPSVRRRASRSERLDEPRASEGSSSDAASDGGEQG